MRHSETAMAPPQQHLHRQPQASNIARKVELTYKLFLLETGRHALELELRNMINKAYAEVQSFLNSSFSPSMFRHLANTLDIKCQALDKLSDSLKNLNIECQFCVLPAVINGKGTNQLQPLKQKGTLKTDVFKFGPMFQNVLIANSTAKAVQVLGATLSRQEFKHFNSISISQPTVDQDDLICGITSSIHNSTIQTTNLSGHLKVEQNQHVIFEKQCHPDARILKPAIIQEPKIDTERPSLFLPSIQPVLPEISNMKPPKVTPQITWGNEDDVVVQHQKQTSSQLLHFLIAKAKIMGALEVTVMEWSKSTSGSASLQQTSPAIQTPSYQFRHVENDDLINALAKKTLKSTAIGEQSPVFRLKQIESSGSLAYTCLIATETELWDIGDIFTEVAQDDLNNSPLEKKDCCYTTGQMENSCQNNHTKNETFYCTEPEKESNYAPVIKNINIPEFQSQKFEETEVVVSHIVSPGNFYIQHADGMMKLQAFITDCWKATSSYALQKCIPDIGTQVMGWFPKQEQWCRSQVTKICGVSRAGGESSITVEVKRLDYGDTACLSLLNITEMIPDMAILPLQAIQVSLENVVPVNGRDWSKEAVSWFKAAVHNRTLYARLYPQGPRVKVELFLEKGKLGAMRRSAPLSFRLAQNGHAKHNQLKNVGLMKRRNPTLKGEEDWQKYLISQYTQKK